MLDNERTIGSSGDEEGRPRDDDAVGVGSVSRPIEALLPLARQIAREIRLRSEMLEAIDEPRWMILLDIYLAMGDARDTPFMSAAHASSAPVSTAQRYIHDMIEAGLIIQHRSGADQRVTHVSLTPDGLALVGRTLGRVMELRSRG